MSVGPPLVGGHAGPYFGHARRFGFGPRGEIDPPWCGPSFGLYEAMQGPGAFFDTPLTLEEKDATAAYGSHASCDANAEFLRKEIGDFVQKGFWMVLPFSTVRKDPNLRLSPAGLILQRDHWDRLIIDYTWSGVNQATQRLAPDLMQYGRFL